LFKKIAGIDLAHIPYKGGGLAMIDVMSGHVPVMFTSVTQVLPNVRTGRIRMLAVGAAQRLAVLPDMPTVAESGFPGYEVAVWWGVSAPAGTPRAVLDKLRREINTVLGQPETQKLLAGEAAEIRILTPAELRKFIHDEVKKWTGVAKEAGIRVQ
jgi:tripartite-type tricarboxylate transporter receptor subunit TctC